MTCSFSNNAECVPRGADVHYTAMPISHYLLLGTALVLSGCLPMPQAQREHDPLQNPLYAERYYDELVENLVSLSIHNNPLLQEKGKEKKVERARRDALIKAREVEAKQRGGTKGTFIPMEEYARGVAFLDGHILSLSPDFEVTPGLSLHLFLTTAVDPRDVEFPDQDAIDLGPLKSAYGAQEFPVKLTKSPILYRTAVLWDQALERLVSFAQLGE